jgi:hypothetical protein
MATEAHHSFDRPHPLGRRTVALLALWGLTVWAIVAVSMRLVGHVLLSPANPALVVGFFGSVVPLMALVTYPVYRRLGIPRGRRGAAAAVLSIPGLFLDVGLVLGVETVYPLMGPGTVRNYAAVLLFGYAVVLVTGFVPGGNGE